jgi:glutamine synthetase
MDVNVYHLSAAERNKLNIKVLPTSLKEALEEWKNDEICIRALGKESAEKYMELKIQEWKEYEPHISKRKNEVTQWEVQKYLYS